MKKHSLYLALSLFTVAKVALAADSESTNAFKWSGPYAGINIGYIFSDNKAGVQTFDPQGSLVDPSGLSQSVLFPSQLSAKLNGVIAGGQIGYNFQSDQYVYGLEADLSVLPLRKSSADLRVFSDASKAPNPDYNSVNTEKLKLTWLGTIRGRFGYAVDKIMFYGTGGIAYGRVNTSSSFIINNVDNPPADSLSGSKSVTKVGYAIGAGMEYAISPNMIAKVEYMHYDLGRVKYNSKPDTFTDGDIPGVYQSVSYRTAGDSLKLGLNFKF